MSEHPQHDLGSAAPGVRRPRPGRGRPRPATRSRCSAAGSTTPSPPACTSRTRWWSRPSPPTGGRRRGWCCSRASTTAASCSSPTTSPARPRSSPRTRRVSLLFPWHELQRQVRVEGIAHGCPRRRARPTSPSRPRESQLGAWASPQSRVVASRAALDERYGGGAARFGDGTTSPCRRTGVATASRPDAVEFWQGRQGRMHDRLRYRRPTPTRTRRGRWSGSPPEPGHLTEHRNRL